MSAAIGPGRAALLVVFFAAAAAAACTSLPPAAPADSASHDGSTALHREASRELAAIRWTAYSHRTHVDEDRGIFQYDCSGFVDYALSRSAPDAFDTLQVMAHRPRAADYVELLSAIRPGQRRGRWARLGGPGELQAGDIVAVLKWSDKPDAWGMVNTGHVMIADGPATPGNDGEWVVPIIDSSGGHGGSDVRSSQHTTGLGRGTIVLLVDRGAVVGLRWREGSPKAIATTVVLGRLQ